MKRLVIAFLVIAAAAVALAESPAARGDDPEPRSVAVTVYNGNLGLVRDERRIALERGIFTLPFRDVAAQIDPTSVAFRALRAGGAVNVLEQNYEYDLLTPQALLDKYVGEEVTLVTLVDGEERSVRARLLSTQGGAVYQIGDSIALNPPGRVVLPALKGDLKSSPTLVWTLASDRAGDEPVEVSYLTGGISWKADYVATLSSDDRELDLGGWVTIDNRSGTTYPDARLKLVAGDIHRAPQEDRQELARRALAMADAAESPSAFEERAFFEYHLYDLPRPTTIKNNQTKQIRLLETATVRTAKVYRLAGARWYYTQRYGGEKGLKVGVYQEFENRERDGLGVPLPAGVVRLYKADADGTLQFVGEDRIDHTPRDEKVVLKVGDAFDVVADRRQTEFEVVASGHVWEQAFEVQVRNHKEEAVVVQVVEPLPGDWQMLSTSHDYEKLDAFTVRFDLRVPPGGATTLTYRIRIKY
ncbi:MAG TPA: DUF4139 domain-containing protein [Gemmatimonadota bacterium]|nr:DUF4139 domain-containing protein [Gemmatimonadota bacterium]